MAIKIVLGDITQLPQRMDAIVNAANRRLVPGGGVDGAINAAAGPELAQAMLAINGTPTGTAVMTPAFGLNASYVIHAVGPIYHTGRANEAGLLRRAYYSAFNLMTRHALRTVAVPLLSTGVYGYPIPEAVAIAINVAHDFPELTITFVALEPEVFAQLERMTA
ncbi:macro domain-containing protein [Lacticaseibacillus brantae]|nr:macro domain-containing protein [Lacticaseibacillus brantae]